MTKTTPGREIVQIVRIDQPSCSRTFGVSPCTASGTADTKCYNTRTTCQDLANYRDSIEGGLSANSVYPYFAPIPIGDLDTSNDLFWAVDLNIPASPEGVIWEAGSSAGSAVWVGWNAGNLVYRAGDGTTTGGTAAAFISTPATSIKGKSGTLYGQIDVSANSIQIWFHDPIAGTVTSIASDTGSAFTFWATLGDGGVGFAKGGVAAGESEIPYNGMISELRIFSNTIAPDFETDFTQSLYFSRGNVSEQRITGAPYVIPSLVSVSTSPTKVNLAGSNPDAQGLGNRALCSLTFQDHPHTDRVVDPYVDGRTFDPYERGSFWTKWMARNKYRTGIKIRIYEGYAGEVFGRMTVREYLLEKVTGPNSQGRVTITGKDILAQAEERKAQAPTASPGELWQDIEADDTSLTVTNAVASDYPSSGTVRIGDELITYSSTSVSNDRIVFAVSQRGADGTTADGHSAEAQVQACKRYAAQPVNTIIADLLSKHAGIPLQFLDLDAWESEISRYLPEYLLSSLITEPTPVADLISEIQEQAGAYIWWDEREQLVKMKAIRGIDSDPNVITEVSNILEGSMSLEELPRQRVSQVWFYYDQRDPTQSVDEEANYRSAYIRADLQSEAAYGQPSIRKIYSRWIESSPLAQATAARIGARYVDTPRQATFQMDAKDRDYGIGDVLEIDHFLDVDQYGENTRHRWTVVSWEEVQPGEVVQLLCEDTTLYGRIYFIQSDSEGDYQESDAGSYYGWITDNDGFYSNGDAGTRIS